jgi:hypothetical protein
MNFIYRIKLICCWDFDDLGLDDAERAVQKLTISFVLQRLSQFVTFACPVTHADEPAVREWLAGPRVLGHLRKTWGPLLDGPA